MLLPVKGECFHAYRVKRREQGEVGAVAASLVCHVVRYDINHQIHASLVKCMRE